MKRYKISPLAGIVLLLLIALSFSSCDSENKNARIKALIINGQMNASHNDKESSPMLKKMLLNTGIFSIDVATSPSKGSDMSSFMPEFKNYDVVVLDYDGDEWPDETKINFVNFVKEGGGVVVVHSADNAFPEWKEFNEIIGLGGWNGRNENHGPYVYWENGEVVKDDTIGSGGSHGDQTEVLVETRNIEHPIMKGLPSSWVHAKDELYGNLRGPGLNMDILATAYSDPKTNGTGKHEPALFTVRYGEGRTFHTVFGHVKGDGPHIPLECAGFITTFQRGAEWAATGEVTQAVPVDFPNFAGPIRWRDLQSLSLDDLIVKIKKYQVGESTEYLSNLSERIRKSDQSDKTIEMYEKAMIDILESNATSDSKNYICRELSLNGTSLCVPTLEKLKAEDECGEMAEYALTRIQK